MKDGEPEKPIQQQMTLSAFVKDLLQKGSVILSPEIHPFSNEDLDEVAGLIERYHQWDAFHLPLDAPDYEPKAAVWAASYLYRALQFLLLRNLGEDLIEANLQPYDGEITAAAVYSADLLLRNLPHVYDLARSLSPSDPLVLKMQEIARKWPFSAVGIPVEDAARIPDHPSLQLAYADRVIAAKDRKSARETMLNFQIQAALGNFAPLFWPEFEPLTNVVSEQ
jgi:hypothetical protein